MAKTMVIRLRLRSAAVDPRAAPPPPPNMSERPPPRPLCSRMPATMAKVETNQTMPVIQVTSAVHGASRYQRRLRRPPVSERAEPTRSRERTGIGANRCHERPSAPRRPRRPRGSGRPTGGPGPGRSAPAPPRRRRPAPSSSGCGTGSPTAGSTGDGTSPVSTIRLRWRSTFGFGTGTADSRACVYGCAGRSYTSSRLPISTILPRYITATRSAMWRTTERSWATNR